MTPPAGRGWPHPWSERWLDQHATALAMRAWRGVHAQHAAATMRLVDSPDEQAVLEQLLDAATPPAPAAAKHPLLAEPFRQRPRHPGRFRRAGGLGVWYGAATLRTACAEVAYWRWRFVTDSAGLSEGDVLTEHLFFSAAVLGRALDLTVPPWRRLRARWTHGTDYAPTHALADAARERGLQWLRYESVRDPGGSCAAVFDPAALDAIDLPGSQTWHCRATRGGVCFVRGSERLDWQF